MDDEALADAEAAPVEDTAVDAPFRGVPVNIFVIQEDACPAG